MSAITKRQQARNEKELNELLRLPGNNQCADCQARNPGWASWSLGIFLCIRCASIHRKLGTHISKVKSLSMDTWTGEQVQVCDYNVAFDVEPSANSKQSMKQMGNVAANKIYNPRNKRPDIPLDVDEVDSAMERYIRKKYQEKSLSDGRPVPPARNDPEVQYSRNEPDTYDARLPEDSPLPPLPPKKGRFFGFGLRAVSSAYPLSKHDKKSKNSPVEPRVDHAFRIGSENYNTPPRSGGGSRMSEDDLQRQLITLREMGFRDTQRNTALLRATDGDIERTIATLVKMDERDARNAASKQTPSANGATARNKPTNTAFPTDSEVARSQPPRSSTNPFDQTPASTGSTQGFSLAPAQLPQPSGRSYQSEPQGFQSNNPFDAPAQGQTDQGLVQTFQGMQVSQPLFPHSTGGHPAQAQFLQDPRLQQSMSPPIPVIPQQYGYTSSPTIMPTSNPFFQSGAMQPNLSSNPYASMTPQQPVTQQNNPFFQQQQQQQQYPPVGSQQNTGSNPFGIPPQSQPQQYAQQQVQQQTQPQVQSQSIFDYPQQSSQQARQQQQHLQSNFEYSQQPQYGGQQLQNGAQQMPQTQTNPYMQHQQQSQQFQQQLNFQQQPVQYQPQFQAAQQPLMPQQTSRYDKSSILALYNYPQLAPQQSLASIPEPIEGHAMMPGGEMASQKRSATMPVSSMHSAGGVGNRNPFMSNTSGGSSAPMAHAPTNGGIMARHASAESVQINSLQSGRHSPDAFANLSARYMR
jgi:hypothetical protein